jgi:hypothetical protein
MESMTKQLPKELLFQYNLQFAYRRQGAIAHHVVNRCLRMFELRHVRNAWYRWQVCQL